MTQQHSNPEPQPDQSTERQRFARVRELFALAQGLSPAERQAMLQMQCAGDVQLQSSVEQLLAADDAVQAASHFGLLPGDSGLARKLLEPVLGELPGGPAHSPQEVPQQIGPYRITGVLGQGGMGIVYLAQQSNPQREVALKILRAGPGSAGLRSRFGREVRVLGRLEHPGIARIYEAGTTPAEQGSQAYFAMEYVRGQRLTDYADRMSLDTAARVELVAKVADAVQHAHGKGVIHRDLKPANILIADEQTGADSRAPGTSTTQHVCTGATPKILDFGVARLAEPDTQHTAVTERGLLIGTIAYMSPEQLSGDNDAVDTRSDVYSMGVILYELLTGRLPHDLRTKPVAEAARIVRDDEPLPLAATGHTTANPTGVQRFDRDLETIVARAIARDVDRRYATASALADDLRRYIRHEPILARPPTTAYQVSKFVRRNRGLVIGAATAAVALIVGTLASSILYLRAREAASLASAEAARATAAAADATAASTLATAETARATREAKLSAAVREYMIDGLLLAASPDRMGYEVKMMDVLANAADGLHERFADSPEVEAGVRVTLGEVFELLGKLRDGEAQFKLAIPMLEAAAGKDDPRVISAMISLSSTLQRAKRDKEWLAVSEEALQRARRVFPAGHVTLIRAIVQLGAAMQTLGKSKEALPLLQEGLEMAKRDPVANKVNIPLLMNWLTTTQDVLGKAEASVDVMRAAVEHNTEQFGPNHPSSVAARCNLVNALTRAGKSHEAVLVAEGLLEAIDKAFAPGDVARGQLYRTVGIAYRVDADYARAEPVLLKSYEILEAAFPEFNWSTEQVIQSLRWLYAEWPDHGPQLHEWGMHEIKSRMMLAHANEGGNLPAVLKTVGVACAEAGAGISRAALVDMLWTARDRLAPPGHPRRAAFFANFARICIGTGQPTHYEESIQLAESALPYATEAEVATELIAAAKALRPR